MTSSRFIIILTDKISYFGAGAFDYQFQSIIMEVPEVHLSSHRNFGTVDAGYSCMSCSFKAIDSFPLILSYIRLNLKNVQELLRPC